MRFCKVAMVVRGLLSQHYSQRRGMQVGSIDSRFAHPAWVDVVPTERVRLTKETTTHDETVSGEVRKEQVDTDVDSTDRKRRQGRGGVEGGDQTSRHGERRDQGQGKPPRR